MTYLYFPGCSLEAVGRPYDVSLRAVFRRLGQDLREIDDWNCCGATAFMSVNETSALALAARNLALAEAQGGDADVIAPCSACYLVLRKTRAILAEQPRRRAEVTAALEAVQLAYGGGNRVRHPLHVLVDDVGLDAIAARVVRPLHGVRVAPYYGCQLVRPDRSVDDPETPTFMDRLFARVGADVVDTPMKVRCCGGMLMTTATPVAQRLSADILSAALDAGANVVATTCPLCQVNLELDRRALSRAAGRRLDIPVVYFTQLLGLALGLTDSEVGLPLNLVPLGDILTEPPHRVRAHV